MMTLYFLSNGDLPDGPHLYWRPVEDHRMAEHWLELGDFEVTKLQDGYLVYGMRFRKHVPYVREALAAGDRVLIRMPHGPMKNAALEDRAFRS